MVSSGMGLSSWQLDLIYHQLLFQELPDVSHAVFRRLNSVKLNLSNLIFFFSISS